MPRAVANDAWPLRLVGSPNRAAETCPSEKSHPTQNSWRLAEPGYGWGLRALDRIRIDRTHIVGSVDPFNPVTIYKAEQIQAVDGIADGDP